jgi:hypothetical protein
MSIKFNFVSHYIDQAMNYMTEIRFALEAKNYLFVAASSLTLGATPQYIQWVLGVTFSWAKRQEC